MTAEKSYADWYFLLIVLGIYAITLLFNQSDVLAAGKFFITILIKIIPIFLLVFILIALTNYFVQPKTLVKYMGKDSGIKGWFISIFAGIISTGPIYMWYPLLNDLQKYGVRNGLIATFLYNRAVKIPLLPMLILYFGLAYTIVLMIVMIVVSVFQGIITEKLMEVRKMKIAVASEKDKEDSIVCPTAGRAPHYIIFENGKIVKTIKNPFAVGGGGAGFGVAQMLENEGVDFVISGKFGHNVVGALDEKGIKHKEVQNKSVKEAVAEATK